jgi:hypothetical protein
VVLEVAPCRAEALSLYRARQFEVVDRREASDEESGRRLVYLHLRTSLTPSR